LIGVKDYLKIADPVEEDYCFSLISRSERLLIFCSMTRLNCLKIKISSSTNKRIETGMRLKSLRDFLIFFQIYKKWKQYKEQKE